MLLLGCHFYFICKLGSHDLGQIPLVNSLLVNPPNPQWGKEERNRGNDLLGRIIYLYNWHPYYFLTLVPKYGFSTTKTSLKEKNKCEQSYNDLI